MGKGKKREQAPRTPKDRLSAAWAIRSLSALESTPLAIPPSPDAQWQLEHAPNNVAKSSLIPDSIVSRTQLRPKYGHGWQPGLDPRPRAADGRGPGEEEST